MSENLTERDKEKVINKETWKEMCKAEPRRL